jgi:hypothetical protein
VYVLLALCDLSDRETADRYVRRLKAFLRTLLSLEANSAIFRPGIFSPWNIFCATKNFMVLDDFCLHTSLQYESSHLQSTLELSAKTPVTLLHIIIETYVWIFTKNNRPLLYVSFVAKMPKLFPLISLHSNFVLLFVSNGAINLMTSFRWVSHQ